MATNLTNRLLQSPINLLGSRVRYINALYSTTANNNKEAVEGDLKKSAGSYKTVPKPKDDPQVNSLVRPSQEKQVSVSDLRIRVELDRSGAEELEERLVRISRPSKNVMQSGTAYTNTWKIEFNNQQRWENWLMGWTSNADPLSNLSINFPTKEQAVAFCEKNHLNWFVEEQPERKIRKKSYADNFSWNKRTRLGSK